MCPQVHNPHLYTTLTYDINKIAAWRQSAYTYFLNSRGSESPVCSAAREPPICTTGSQQPTSRQPSPATAVVETPQGDGSQCPPS